MTRVKKAKPRKARAKSSGSIETVTGYLARVPQPARAALLTMRAAIRSAVPAEAVEVISYRIPAFKHERVLVWYAAFSDHCSLFPTAAVIEGFKNELKGYTLSKGTIHFPLDKPVPVLLIKKLVKGRVAQAKIKAGKAR